MSRPRSPVDRVFDAIVPRAVDAIDPDELVERIDLDALLARTDLNALLGRLDLDVVLGRLDLDALIGRLDVDALIQRVDVDALVQRVDVDRLVQRVDVDALVKRVDVGGIVEQVDVDGLVQRVDIDGLVGRVDLDAVLEGVDIRGIVSRAGIDQAIAETATGLVGRTLDLVRRKVHRADALLLAVVDRVLGRRGAARHPEALHGQVPAGPLARVLGFVADATVVSASFSLFVAIVGNLASLFTGHDFDTADDGGLGWAVAFFGWWFVYLWASIGLGGRTVGKGLVGIRVVGSDLLPASPRAAFGRAVTFPFSFVLGLGFVPAVVGPRRRALHDLIAGTQELVDDGADRRQAGDDQTSGVDANRLSPSASER
ncbi:MAG: RDD family protein [Acidimicrobiales bacterium]|nr:RDD family protein [Acidimicrobiales bacterium]